MCINFSIYKLILLVAIGQNINNYIFNKQIRLSIIQSMLNIIKQSYFLQQMQKLKKNISAIEHKFQSLKLTNKSYEEPTLIGQVAEIMTYGVVRQSQVQDYLNFIHSNQTANYTSQKDKPNENWQQLNFQQMILFLDKVIKHKNIPKPGQNGQKERLSLNLVQKKKTKKKNSDTHQNPYIPKYGQAKDNDKLTQNNQNIMGQNADSRLSNLQQKQQGLQNTNQTNNIQQQTESQIDEATEQLFQKYALQNQQNETKKQTIQQLLDLPQDFKSLPVAERYEMLASKYQKIKKIIQKKFAQIYKNYRKQMYNPNQSFATNNDLLMDLRLFLKYYRQFQINKKYRANDATQHFKKIALNGLWLDYGKFIDVHYKLIQILAMNSEIDQQLQTNMANPSQQLKKQLSRNAKILMQNLLKMKDLNELINDDKLNRIFNNSPIKFVKKIVQTHSGLIKEDVLLKLSQRNQVRKKRSSNLLTSRVVQTQVSSPRKDQLPSPVLKPNVSSISVYRQLQLPKLRSPQMKKSSIYSSLQLLNMYKQKQKLKQLINEQESQKYLQQYFKKEKLLNAKLSHNRSLTMNRNYTQNMSSSSKLKETKNSAQSYGSILRSNLSLPRMKFS